MQSIEAKLAQLRFAVGFLGGRAHAGWWDCSFLSDAGLAFAAFNFPRAPQLAAYSATVAAATRLHDERIGKSGVFHLFRLPLEQEIAVHRTAAENAGALFTGAVIRRNEQLTLLKSFIEQELDAPAGPVQVGSVEDVRSDRGVAEMAQHYLSAFERGIHCFPFFAASK